MSTTTRDDEASTRNVSFYQMCRLSVKQVSDVCVCIFDDDFYDFFVVVEASVLNRDERNPKASNCSFNNFKTDFSTYGWSGGHLKTISMEGI